MSKTYDEMVDKAAAKLESVLRNDQSNQPVYVIAWPTTNKENGRIEISPGGNSSPMPSSVVRPLNSVRGSWNHVPYSAIRSQLWQALRSEPILPIHP